MYANDTYTMYDDSVGNTTDLYVPDAMSELEQNVAYLMMNISDWQTSMIQDYHVLGKKCMLDFWNSPPEEPFCNATWDRFKCWKATPVNTTVIQSCPDTSKITVNDTEAVAHRTCLANGSWMHGTWTNYTLCVVNIFQGLMKNKEHHFPYLLYDEELEMGDLWKAVILRDIYFYGSILSFLLLTMTLLIFICFKSLHCNRISIHKNLVISFIIRCIIFIVFFEPFVTGRESSYREIDWLCKLLTSILYYSLVANIFWMFVEGLFLHNRVAVSVFNTEAPFRVFYVIGWGSPALIVLAWAICMHEYNPRTCWVDTHKHQYIMWIIIVPVLVALSINTVFLVNIIRILITKLRANNTVELDQVRKAVKATVILFPLLGMAHLLLFFKPRELNEGWEMAYRITHAIFQAAQGVFVSVIYCFMNSEVRIAVMKKWQRYKSSRMNKTNGRRRSSTTGRTSNSTCLIPLNGVPDKGLSESTSQAHPWTTIV